MRVTFFANVVLRQPTPRLPERLASSAMGSTRALRVVVSLLVATTVSLAAAPVGQAAKKVLIFRGLVQNLRVGFVWVEPSLRAQIDPAALQTAAQRHTGFRLAAISRLPTAYPSLEQTAAQVLKRLPASVTFVASWASAPTDRAALTSC